MRVLTICLAVVASLMLQASAFAQSLPSGPWRGVWTKPGYEYQAQLDLSIQAHNRVAGRLTWMLVQSPRPDYQTKVGLRGVEHVEGVFDPASGALTLRGTKLEDPNGILGTDIYRLIVSPNGKFISGLTAAGGTWEGRVEFIHFGKS